MFSREGGSPVWAPAFAGEHGKGRSSLNRHAPSFYFFSFTATNEAFSFSHQSRRASARSVASPQLLSGGSFSVAEEAEFTAPIRSQYERQGSPYYSTARLWDDGVIDPLDTRRVLGMGLAVAAQAPVEPPSYGVFRM